MPTFSLKMVFLGLIALVALAGTVEAAWIQEIDGWTWTCVKDTSDNHFHINKYTLTSNNSPQNCIDKCTEENGGNLSPDRIGVKDADECWCFWNPGYDYYGDYPYTESYSYNGEMCKARVCTGDSSAVCGGTGWVLSYGLTY